MDASATLARLAAKYWDWHLAEHPAEGFDHGHPAGRHGFFRESLDDHARRDSQRAAFQRELHGISPDALAGQDAHSYRLLERELAAAREQHALDAHVRPALFPFGPEMWIAYAINKTTLLSANDADDYVTRLRTIPGYLRDCEARLAAGVTRGHRLSAVLLERVIANIEGYLKSAVEQSIWYRPLVAPPGPAGAFTRARAEVRALVGSELRPAYAAFAGAVRRIFSGHCRESITCTDAPEGGAFYDSLVRLYTTLEIPAGEIHELGRAEVARIDVEMRRIAAEAGHAGDAAAFHQHMLIDPRFFAKSKEELRDRIEILSKRIDRRIPEFFGLVPRTTYGVELIPVEIAAGSPPAYAQPNPASGTASGIHWVTSLPERCPSYLHVPLALHEAWPGHLMHIALLQEMHDLPAFRRYGAFNYIAYLEGWALYCESLGLDMGLYADAYAHYGRLQMEMWRALRLVVDTGIHLHGWTRERAVTYMQEYLAMPAATIEAEVDRYIGMPGQALAYKLGERKIQELRRRAETTLGARFALRDFHDRLMTAGPVTLPVLEDHVAEWIAARACAA